MDTRALIGMFGSMADAIEAAKDHLCELDGAIGDADHGVTMALGFSAVRTALTEMDANQAVPVDVFNTTAKAFLNAVGASAGPLYATAFMRAGAAVKGKTELDTASMAAAITAMAEGIATRGKAEAGDKTMLDAWLPAADAARTDNPDQPLALAELPIAVLLQRVADAARQGADATVELVAKKGRSAKLGDRSIGHMDPGAESTAILLRAMADYAGNS